MEEAYRSSSEDTLRNLRVQAAEGLSTKEAKRRLKEFGPNELPRAKKTRLILLFLDRFRDILVLILVIAGVISVAIGHIEDAVIIAIAIALDSTLSFIQVWRTEKTLEQMRKKTEDTSSVIRDGQLYQLPAHELVPGDILEIRAGEQVAADARLVRTVGIKAQEAVLTGEASDVDKNPRALTRALAVADRRNMLFAGTTIVSGTGTAVVVSTGTRTEFGKIAQLLRDQRSPSTPLRQKLQKTGLMIGWVIIGSIGVIAGISIFKGASLAETFHTAITLIVSAIPEDLTMILTIALTVGVRRILKHGGVVRRLSSGETLGSATVVCTDKTGTLTEGKMKATGLHFLQGDELDTSSKPEEEMHKLAYIGIAISSDARRVGTKNIEYLGSATERTGLAFVERAGFIQSELQKSWRSRDAITFNTKWKYRAALVDHPTLSTQTLFVVGAPDVLLEKSSQALDTNNQPVAINGGDREALHRKIELLASQGKRLMAVTVRRNLNQVDMTHKDVTNLLFLGVLAITDPVRSEASAAIRQTINAGVSVKLITGDHASTASSVANQVGIETQPDMIITGQGMQELSDKELSEKLERLTIFARVEPLDKQRIIRLLQEAGHVVAMTGDGINDAVALKGADIGVAVQSGSDVAREASDLILLDNSFATIVAAIKEGRVLRDNVRKVIIFLLATNAAEVAIFFVSLLFGFPLPLIPAQILWINLVTDGTSDIALSLEPAEHNVMSHGPEKPDAPLIGKNLIGHIVFSGIAMTISTMGLFIYILEHTNDLAYARTMAFTILAVSSLLSVWSFRSLQQSILKRGFFQNPWVLISSGFSFLLQLTAIYAPFAQTFFGTVSLSARDWVYIFGIAIITVIVIEARKILLPKTGDWHTSSTAAQKAYANNKSH